MRKKEILVSQFGIRLKQLMEENNETVYTLSSVVNLNPSTISRYTKGIMTPKIPTIQILAEYFCVNPTWLMGLSDERNSISQITEIELDDIIKNMYSSLNLSSKNKLLVFTKRLLEIQSK